MQVYIVNRIIEFESCEVDALFSTEDKAKAYIKICNDAKEYGHFEIQKMTVDAIDEV